MSGSRRLGQADAGCVIRQQAAGELADGGLKGYADQMPRSAALWANAAATRGPAAARPDTAGAAGSDRRRASESAQRHAPEPAREPVAKHHFSGQPRAVTARSRCRT
jgi:hypothetical protein